MKKKIIKIGYFATSAMLFFSLHQLFDGNKKFQSSYVTGAYKHEWKELVKNQSPKVLIFSCSDSRVDPALIMNTKPGDLFVVRTIANLVPSAEKTQSSIASALEFAVKHLRVKHIIVMGHSQCGAIKSLFALPSPGSEGYIQEWMKLAQKARNDTLKKFSDEKITTEQQANERITYCSQHSAVDSLENLLTYPWIKKAVKDEMLFLHAWFFDLVTGTIKAYDEKTKTWMTLTPEIIVRMSEENQ